MSARLHDQTPRGLPPALRSLTAPCYVHRAPQGKLVALLATALLFVLSGLGYVVWAWTRGRLDGSTVALGVFVLPFFLLLMRPASWRAPVVMAADRQGIFFVGTRDSVLVPWRETGPFTIERAMTAAGAGQCVIVTIAEHSAFWDPARKSRFRADPSASRPPPGFLRVPLGNQGIDPEVTRASLESLRRRAGVDVLDAIGATPARYRLWEAVIGGALLVGIALVFGVIMLQSVLERGEPPSLGLLGPLLTAVLGAGVLRYGWRHRR